MVVPRALNSNNSKKNPWLLRGGETPCAVERDVRGSHCSEVQSDLRSGKAHPPTKELFHNNSYALDDQGDNPGQVIEGSTVFSKTVNVASILISNVKDVGCADWAQAERRD